MERTKTAIDDSSYFVLYASKSKKMTPLLEDLRFRIRVATLEQDCNKLALEHLPCADILHRKLLHHRRQRENSQMKIHQTLVVGLVDNIVKHNL